MCYSLLSHTLPCGDVALVHDLAAEHLRSEAVCKHGEKQDDACVNSNLLQ